MKHIRPFDNRGRFVPLGCINQRCGYGKLYHEGDGFWECDGLMDPEDSQKELEICDYGHRSGDPWPYQIPRRGVNET